MLIGRGGAVVGVARILPGFIGRENLLLLARYAVTMLLRSTVAALGLVLPVTVLAPLLLVGSGTEHAARRARQVGCDALPDPQRSRGSSGFSCRR